MTPHAGRRDQRGVALVCALMLMLCTMVIGVAVARGAFAAVATARNERDREVAWAAAEAALRDAERDIAGTAAPLSARAAQFGATGAAAFTDNCGRGAADLGLCRTTAPPAWQRIDLTDPDQPALVPYGRFTDATLAVGQGLAPVRLPAYLIERLEPAGATAAQGTFYRISAIGFGLRASTRVVLQGLYRKPAPAPPGAGGDAPGTGPPGGDGADSGADGGSVSDPGTGDAPGRPPPAQPPHQLPAGRIGWREIANWSELHARLQD